MKSKTLKFIAGAVALLIGASCASAALEGGRWYADAKGGLDSVMKLKQKNDGKNNSKQKMGYGFSIAGGYALDAWRFELEGSYRRAKMKEVKISDVKVNEKGRVTFLSLMGNVYYDIPVADAFAVYVGGGLGYSRMEIKSDALSFGRGKGNLFAYQLMAGVGYNFTDNWTATLGYRFFSSFNKPKVKVPAQANKKTSFKLPFVHAIELGVRYTF